MMKNCIHYWYIEDNERYHQIGTCKYCGQIKDFGENPTIVLSNGLITTDYYFDSFTSKLNKNRKFTDREFRYPKPKSGMCIPFRHYGDEDSPSEHNAVKILESKGSNLYNAGI